jgi:hypothetical protein
MKRIPHSREVAKAMRTLKASVKTAWKGVNRAAGKVIAKGNYAEGEELAARGRKVKEFLGSVEALDREWRTLAKGSAIVPGKPSSGRLPQWEYYQPILRALVELGGVAPKTQLEPIVERLLSSRLQAGDRDFMSGNRERWQVMVHRARRHMRTEGWITDAAGAKWHITAEGRRAAQGQPSSRRAPSIARKAGGNE